MEDRVDLVGRALARRFGLDLGVQPAVRARIAAALEDPAIERLGDGTAAQLDALVQHLRVGETRFFRDPEQLEALGAAREGAWSLAAKVNMLSAGCSTGEEAWTLAMLLERVRGRLRAADRVDAIDLSPTAIESAERALYAPSVPLSVPAPYAAMFEQDEVAARPRASLRAHVRFRVADLLVDELGGPFDAIVCRNVLIYLAADQARALLTKLGAALAPEGLLLVSRAEGPRARDAGLTPVSLAGGAVTAFAARSLTAPPAPREERLTLTRATTADAIAEAGRAALARGPSTLRIARTEAPSPLDEDAQHALERLIAAARAIGVEVIDDDGARATRG